MRHLAMLLTCAGLLAGWAHLARSDDALETDDRPYLLERVDDAAVVQVYADGFEGLPLPQKQLVWHLYQAALAGRDIYYDQCHADSLEMRALLEGILRHPDGVVPETLAEIRRYTKLFWINSGPYSNATSRKFVLRCTPEEFAAAVQAAAEAGARVSTRDGETLAAKLERLGPMFFDPDHQPILTNKTPGPGKDILASSANNLYVGVTMDDLDGFTERYGLNSQLVKTEDGQLVERVYRVDGLYGDRIERIIRHLTAALEFAPEPTAEALRALIRYYQTGEVADRKAYDIAWVRDNQSNVDTINGFIEVYMDPRGVKGSWESAVFYVNEQKTEAIRTLAGAAQWFEDHMPWDPKYRKPDVRGITANAIEVVIETGDCGPVSPIGINLPNDLEIREAHGSKSVSLSNIIEAYEKSRPESQRTEFAWTPEEVERDKRWGGLVQELHVNMHEVIGHASGRVSDDLQGQPADSIREFYSTLEEARADLVSLYFLPDPKLAELGLVAAEDQAEVARTAYENYARNVLTQLRRVREGSQIEGDHMRNRQMIVHWLMDNTDSIAVRQRDGKTYYVLTDPAAFRAGVAKLLAEVQRIKSEGDYDAAKALIEAHGIHFDPALRDEVVARVDALNLPSYTGFVMPRLEAVRGLHGTITDVRISYPQDLTTQMLEYSAAVR